MQLVKVMTDSVFNSVACNKKPLIGLIIYAESHGDTRLHAAYFKTLHYRREVHNRSEAEGSEVSSLRTA